MSRKPDRRLRRGWTTGACATAAVRGAWEALLTGAFPKTVRISLPRGDSPVFELVETRFDGDSATAGVVKDAGDDPDVTHGATILATLRRGDSGTGVTFRAGAGVGTVTMPGLPVAIGEPAVNPAPRAMMEAAVAELAAAHHVARDAEITLSIPGGEAIAAQTWNPRLGIVGGLSILGTTGIVVPYSCSAWIQSIRSGIDVARARGLTHVAAATGNTSERAVAALHRLDETAIIDMGDFVGGMLKYLRDHPIPCVTIAGGFAKMVKLAQGHGDLHSSRSQVDFGMLADWVGELGADPQTVDAVRHANTAAQVLDLAGEWPLPALVARRARAVGLAMLAGGIALEVVVVDRAGRIAARSPE
ncbi:MAG: cobalt-precorrin-5B (C(1))-methyltransferase [Rhodospirillales bacterium]|nr:MAG: cobalt-precorrin-5B (C(1))-methyltransferase [Rhodospirillales bacterium]